MDDLTARITAALDHAERRARSALVFDGSNAKWTLEGPTIPDHHAADYLLDFGHRTTASIGYDEDDAITPLIAHHMVTWDPDAVLDLIAAHREILAYCQVWIDSAKVPTGVHDGRDPDERDEALAIQARDVRAILAKAHRIKPVAQSGTDDLP